MSLTGLPLILLTGGLTVLGAAATVRLWRTAGAWRLPVRATGLILVEVLAVLTAGLIANRAEGFYPSWRALTGDLGTATQTAPQASGRLDGNLAGAGEGLTWTPPAETARRLAAPPTLIPPPEYGRLPGHTFPVIVAITTGAQAPQIRAAAATVPGALTVVLTPGPEVSAALTGKLGQDISADLARLPGQLERDARVTGHDWAIVTDHRFAPLATAWSRLEPGRFRTVTVVDAGGLAAALDSAARQLPEPLAPPMRLPS